VAQGRWDGEILSAPRGQGGFGYDPVMWITELGATVAEMGHDAKNSMSHRARAAALMRQQMAQVWGWPLA
jgi:XTP/dITP diphosphohydrolase